MQSSCTVSEGLVLQDNSSSLPGMLTLTHPVQLVPREDHKETFYDHRTSISIGGRPICNLRLADDIVLDQIFNSRVIIEKHLQHQRDLFNNLIDF